MVRKSAWVLNLDAEDELARPGGSTPSRAVLARFEGLAGQTGTLLGPADILWREGQSGVLEGEVIGRAWCPTPRARRALREAGARLLAAPSLEILRAVNHRRFNAELGQTLPGARYAFDLGEVMETLGGVSPTGAWLLKRPFGFAGRGRLKLRPGSAADMAQARSWIEASLRGGEGLQVEPWVQRRGDFGLHGHLGGAGELVLGEPTRVACDETGAWAGSVRAAAGELSEGEERALFEEARRAAEALSRAGYFGPFGIDAFRWVDAGGEVHFNARGEINARYSMGWATGMGERRPDLDGP